MGSRGTLRFSSRKGRGEVMTSSVFEFRAFVTGRMDDIEAVFEKLDQAVREFYEDCDAKGVSVLQADGLVRPMTRDEILMVVPRKKHLEVDGRQACRTPHVSQRNLVKDKDKVTCKLCRKLIADGGP